MLSTLSPEGRGREGRSSHGDDTVIHRFEAFQYQGIMAREDQIVMVSQFADTLETIVHSGQIVVGGEWYVLLKVVVIVRRIRRHHSPPVLGLDRDNLHAGRMPSHFVDTDARENFLFAVDEHDPTF